MINPSHESQLTNGGDCPLHWHSSDRVVRHDDVTQGQAILRQRDVSGTYTITEKDDILLCASGGTVTLPLAKGGREFEVVMIGATNVTVATTSPDLVYGASTVLMNVLGMALHFKATSGGWLII